TARRGPTPSARPAAPTSWPNRTSPRWPPTPSAPPCPPCRSRSSCPRSERLPHGPLARRVGPVGAFVGEAVVARIVMDGRLAEEPGAAPPVGPGGRVQYERVAEVRVAGPAGGGDDG